MHPVFLFSEAIIEEDQRNSLRIARRNLRDTQDPFQIPDNKFEGFYRLPKALVFDILEKIEGSLNIAQRSTKIPNHLQLLTFLSLVANGGYQQNVGADVNISLSQPTISKCIHVVAHAIDEILAPEYIAFPQRADDMNSVKARFYNEFGFPGIIGAVDGTHIKIQKPRPEVEQVYFNGRKNCHTKNVQIICDLELRIRNINSRYGGTAHDSYVWNNSLVKTHMKRLLESGHSAWLIGDSGYAQRPWLMTPFRTARNRAEEKYNIAHRKARNCVERCIGVLKNRFRILGKDRILRYTPDKCGVIINACAVLHNMLIQAAVPIQEEDLEIEEEIDDVVIDDLSNDEQYTQRGVSERERICNENFA